MSKKTNVKVPYLWLENICRAGPSNILFLSSKSDIFLDQQK